MAYAFKCRSCGNLEEAGNAGARAVPAACRICGAGVSFDPKTGAKAFDEDNWITLADLKGDELQEVLEFHGIKKGEIGRHTPEVDEATREGQAIAREATETIAAEDRP